MKTAADVFTHLLPDGGARPLTADERAIVNDILDAAAAWRVKGMPLEAFANVGPLLQQGKESTRYGRFVAMRVTPKDDPRRADLAAAIDELVWFEGMTATHQGMFSQGELRKPAAYGITVK